MTSTQQDATDSSSGIERRRVLIIGIEPSIIDDASPDFAAFPGMTAEKVINIIHQHAPTARICFNTNPSDTLEALKRWI